MLQSKNYVPPKTGGNWYIRTVICGAVLGVILALII